MTVSVLMPVRNGALTLPSALRSLAWQTFTDWEAVVVDDGSTDGSAAILDQAARLDRRINCVRLPAVGLVGALNAGLERCRGRYVARMDADDVSHPQRLGLQVELLQARPELVGVSCRVRMFGAATLRSGFRRYERWLNCLLESHQIAREMLVESPLVHPSVVIRRSALEQIGGYRDQGWPEDYDLWLRLHERGGRFAKVDRVLFFWRDHPDRLTRTHARYASGQLRRLKVAFLLRHHLPGKDGAVVWGAGRNGKRLARELRRQGGRLLGFADLHPRRIGKLIEHVRVYAPDEAPLGSGVMHLAAVGREGGREAIRRDLVTRGLREEEDFLCMC